MVVTEVCHRDSEEVAVTENMDNSQSNGELVPVNEQNNDETSVRSDFILHRSYSCGSCNKCVSRQ